MADKSSRGLADVVAATTSISDIDGENGRLFYRGYDIHDIAGRISFEECVHLLQRGDLPNQQELDDLDDELTGAREIGPTTEALLPHVVRSASPMEALRTLVSSLSVDDPDANDSSIEADRRKATRLVAQMPILVARYEAARKDRTPVEPDPDLSIAGNFLWQITGQYPSDRVQELFDTCLVLHADHTMNASTFTARVIAATLSDMHSATTGAMGALRGPLHGGANEAVMNTLASIEGDVDAVDEFVRTELSAGRKLMGFGHRVYKTEDPRATHLRKMSEELSELAGDRRYYDFSRRMEQVVFDTKGLYPNVDFYAASVYHTLGIPTDLMTCVFSAARVAGWTAHVREQLADNRLIRPESEYIGPRNQAYVPIEERS
jgi:citrate synthase